MSLGRASSLGRVWGEDFPLTHTYVCVYLHIYIYIYMCKYIYLYMRKVLKLLGKVVSEANLY